MTFLTRAVAAVVFLSLVLAPGPGRAEYGDVVMKSKPERMKKAGVKPVVFPHWAHRIRYKCKVCHDDLFVMKKGANDIYMSDILGGNYCGKCHNGEVAWDFLNCDKCHSYTGEHEQGPVIPEELKGRERLPHPPSR